MVERVYLGDWAYNAGIIGFIEIMLDGEDIASQNIITVGPNYIEFNRNSLQGFSDKFFKKAYQTPMPQQMRHQQRMKMSFFDDIISIAAGEGRSLPFWCLEPDNQTEPQRPGALQTVAPIWKHAG
ncbi:hypothetical protein Calkr_2424 [Caldicellulosiruptor acetigenus I77R1B]|uniref:Uncharacterized protein n=1 Tax=Caldicellulosiruptor acetigenus (strain ATCC 700853 / DSM 12137 / I77R1B) TaxID=632335 RepID=E4S7W0_CALA7|nr:hypothetical protein [Caldicellulosiruptor acetigenus]ADQ41860.1 hypothetical protein Calkr_2424 [Caldicellulosiruptor acetigenus I77R1B]